MSLEGITNTAFLLRNIQCSHVKDVIAWISVLPVNQHNGMITVTWSAKCNPTKALMEHAPTKPVGRKVVKERVKRMPLDGLQLCSTVCQIIAEGGLKWTERPLFVIQLILGDGHTLASPRRSSRRE